MIVAGWAIALVPLPAAAVAQDEAQRVAAFLGPDATGGTGGQVGVFVGQVGSASPALSLNSDVQFEPASSIKALLLLEAAQSVQSGGDSWTDPITVYAYPNSVTSAGDPTSPGLCPLTADEVPQNARPGWSLQDAARGMMWQSDNTLTRAIMLRYGGLPAANATAVQIGMSATTLQQDLIGCAYRDGKINLTTLRDIGRLYESVVAGASVDDPAEFFGLMPSGTWPASSAFSAMVAEEAAKLGLVWSTAARETFRSAAFVASKAGSHILLCGWVLGSSPGCPSGQYAFDVSVAGVQTIPFKDTSGAIVPRTYTWGNFIFGRFGPCPTINCGDSFYAALNNAYLESFRALVRDALTSWKAAGHPLLPAPVPPPPPPPVPPPPPPEDLPLVALEPAPPPPPDRAAPSARLSGSRWQRLRTALFVDVLCAAEPCTARAAATVTANARTYTSKATGRAIGKGSTRRLTLRLSAPARKAIRRALRARKRVVARVRVTVSDAAGNRRTLRRQVRLVL